MILYLKSLPVSTENIRNLETNEIEYFERSSLINDSIINGNFHRLRDNLIILYWTIQKSGCEFSVLGKV